MNDFLIKLAIGIAILVSLVSCEEAIDVTLDNGTPQLAVDALVMVANGRQKVRLTITNPYFNQSKASGATGATVTMTSSLGQIFSFQEDVANPGDYYLDSVAGKTGEIFTLRIDYKGESFTAESELKRGTVIDTLNQEYRMAQFGNPEGNYLNLVAKDSVGINDFYWIRTELNGTKNRRIDAITLSADGAFNPGSSDGLEFIYPIRNGVNLPQDTFALGDTITVELLSIDRENWRFLTEMQTQLNNTGLFAEPIANVRGNVDNLNPNSATTAVGCFGMARVSRAGVRIKK